MKKKEDSDCISLRQIVQMCDGSEEIHFRTEMS